MTDVDLLRMINRTSSEFRRLYHVAMDRSGYTGMRGSGRLLRELERQDEIPQKELASRLEIRPQSLTGALLKLEQAGYIVRRRSEEDKREQFVHITDLGRQRSNELLKMRTEAAGRMFECLTEEEKEQLSGLLGKVVEKFSKPGEGNR